MARRARSRARYDWPALKAKFINQRLEPGSTLTLKQFAQDEDIPLHTLKRRCKGWVEEAEELSQEASEQAMEEQLLHHGMIRKKLLQNAELAHECYQEEMEFYLARRRERRQDQEKAEPLSVQDLRRLQQMVAELFQIGGGLPREHVVHSDDSYDEVVYNREQQKHMERVFKGFREYGEKRGYLRVVRGGKDGGAEASGKAL